MNLAPDCLTIGGHRVVIDEHGVSRLFPQYRYRAAWRDYEPGDPIGYGATPLEAAQELRDICDDMELKP